MNIIEKLLDNWNYTKWRKEYKYIIVHHTWTKTSWENIYNYFNKSNVYASSHYLISKKWEIIRLVNDYDTAWHCWVSQRKEDINLNDKSIWIEVNSDWFEFNDLQRDSTKELIVYLMKKYWITSDRVLRHKDIAPKRKWDIWENFYNEKYVNWWAYQNMLKEEVNNINKVNPGTTYIKLLKWLIKKHWLMFDKSKNSYEQELLNTTNNKLRELLEFYK